MNTIKITTSQNIELEYDLASVGERIVGRIVDGLIIVAYGVLIVLIFINGKLMDGNRWILFLFLLPVVFYDLFSEVFMNGQSVGKRVMNIKVISLNGSHPTLGQYMIRWLFRVIDFSLTGSLCALICVAVSERKQRVGDMIAGTTLIKTIPRVEFHQTIYVPTRQEEYTVSFPEVATLADKDMQLIKEVMLSVNKSGNTMLAYHAAEKIKKTLDIDSNLEPRNFLQVLLSDCNHLTSQV